jgi:hypothetical protein
MNNISDFIKKLSRSLIAQDPNEDPQELYRQVRPTLNNLGIANITDRNRTQLIVGQTQGDDSLYKIVLRRDAEIDDNVIKRLNRNIKKVKEIKWSSQAIEVLVWAPYTAPAEIQETEGEL